MLRIAWQTLRARRSTLAGAFVALWLAVTFAYATGLLMTGALTAPGGGRYAAADAVVRADPSVELGHDLDAVDVVPGPRLDAALVRRAAAVDGAARAIGDVSFPAAVRDAAGEAVVAPRHASTAGHGWPAAALTPYALRAGHAPSRPDDVVADARLGLAVGARVRIATPGGDARYRVAGVAAGGPAGEAALFFAPATARRMAGTPDRVDAIGVFAAAGTPPERLRHELRSRLGVGVEVLDAGHAADADPGDGRAANRDAVIAIFGTMGGIAGAIALFVVAGTFSLAIAQRARETAVLRALGATPHQVRRLIAGEALIVSLVAGALGVLAGGPLAGLIVSVLADHGAVPAAFQPARSWLPLVAALGLGIGISQLAVVAAARRAGRTRPADALREATVEHARPGLLRVVLGLAALGGGVAMALIFSGMWARAFAILAGLLLAAGVGLLGRWLLGSPAALVAWPLRRLGASGLLASTGLAANRWRTAALAMPIVLIAMLAGTQGVVQSSDQRNTERVTAARLLAGHVLASRDNVPLPPRAAAEVAALPSVSGVTAMARTEVYGLDHGLGENSPWPAAGLATHGAGRTLDLDVVAGRLRDVRGRAIAVSRVVAHDGGLRVGDVVRARMADTAPLTLEIAAVYDRAAGLGDVVMDAGLAHRHDRLGGDAALFVAGGPIAGRSLARYATGRPGMVASTRADYLGGLQAADEEQAWAVWMIIGLAAVFAALALVNTAAMATAERRGELATIRLLGGTAGHVLRTVALEMAPTILAALAAGGAIVAVAVAGVPRSLTGVPIAVPVGMTAGLVGGAIALGLMAAVVTARLALRASPAEAMRVRE